MPLLPVAPGIRQKSGSGGKASKAGVGLKSQVEKTLKRDDYTCRFCGFRSKQYQRVVINPDERDKDDYVTACTFCEQCLSLDRAGITGPGVLIWMPEIGQAELNHIVRAIYIARADKNELTDTASRALDALMARRVDAKKRLGSDDPLLLATVMQESLEPGEVAQAGAKLEGIRLLPPDKYLVRTSSGDVNQFPQILKYWRSPEGPYGKLPVKDWLELFKAASSKIGNA